MATEAAALPDTLSAAWFIDEASRRAGIAPVSSPLVDEAVATMTEAIGAIPAADPRRASACGQLLHTLVVRLRYLDQRRQQPGIAAERIERPIIVMGFPRSGTSLLHELLAADPAARGVEWWEAARPSPAGAVADNDPRIALGDRDQGEFLAAMPPAVLAAHPYWDAGGRTLMECERLSWLEFHSFSPTAFWKVPFFGVFRLAQVDPAERFASHRRLLQHLQFERPKLRWALKGVAHQFHLRQLRAAYPDAVLVWVHRDPAVCFASGIELEALIMEGLLGSADRPAIAASCLARNRTGLDHAMADAEALADPGLHHLHYADFTRDPVATLEGLYARAGLPCGSEVRAAWQNWLDDPAHRPDRHGRFTYSLPGCGLDEDAVRDMFADYIARFGIRT